MPQSLKARTTSRNSKLRLRLIAADRFTTQRRLSAAVGAIDPVSVHRLDPADRSARMRVDLYLACPIVVIEAIAAFDGFLNRIADVHMWRDPIWQQANCRSFLLEETTLVGSTAIIDRKDDLQGMKASRARHKMAGANGRALRNGKHETQLKQNSVWSL